jgi:hypothetical protein
MFLVFSEGDEMDMAKYMDYIDSVGYLVEVSTNSLALLKI